MVYWAFLPLWLSSHIASRSNIYASLTSRCVRLIRTNICFSDPTSRVQNGWNKSEECDGMAPLWSWSMFSFAEESLPFEEFKHLIWGFCRWMANGINGVKIHRVRLSCLLTNWEFNRLSDDSTVCFSIQGQVESFIRCRTESSPRHMQVTFKDMIKDTSSDNW